MYLLTQHKWNLRNLADWGLFSGRMKGFVDLYHIVYTSSSALAIIGSRVHGEGASTMVSTAFNLIHLSQLCLISTSGVKSAQFCSPYRTKFSQ